MEKDQEADLMQIVIDTNILLAAFARESTTRKLIIDSELKFCAPDVLVREAEKHIFKDEKFRKKVKLEEEKMKKLFLVLLMRIEIVELEEYQDRINEAESLIPDKNDVPFLALALARNIPVLSQDPHFTKQKKVKIFTIEEILKL